MRLTGRAADVLGGLDILVNNAAMLPIVRGRLPCTLSRAQLRWVMGPMACVAKPSHRAGLTRR